MKVNSYLAVVLALALVLDLASTVGADDALPDAFPTLTGPYLGQTPPGDVPELFAPGIISTGKEHSAAMFTPDGAEVWFGRMFPAAIWFSRLENGVWSEPAVAPFSVENGDLYPHLAPHGNALYFCTARDFDGLPELTSRGDGRLCVTRRTASGWTGVRPLAPEINFSDQRCQLAVSQHGNLFIAARNPEQPDRSLDFFVFRMPDQQLEPPDLFTNALSSSTPDHSPFIAPDESYFIFSSFRSGMGRSDLFISFRAPDGHWTKPVSLGPRINSAAKDEYPHVSPDGKYLFFNSNRPSALNDRTIPDGPGNIYWVGAGFIEQLREEHTK